MKLLLPYAYDCNKTLIHIDNAQKGQKYFCPTCGTELILKISRKTKGQKYYRRNHFAHKGNVENQCSESFLHKYIKEKCAELINSKISKQEDLFFEWDCEKCHERHKGNLLKKAKKVVIEYNLGICKPDIALLDEDNKVVIAIEIVVTHKPEPDILRYYNDNKIACLQVVAKDFEDCEIIEEKLTHPDSVNICPNPICKKCGKRMINPKLVTVTTECYRCKKKMKLAMIAAPGRVLSPAKFNKEEVEIAKTLGVNIQDKYSNTRKDNYLANVCEYCNAFVGDFYIYNYVELMHENEIDLDYRCFHCMDEEERLRNLAEQQALNDRRKKIQYLQSQEVYKPCPECGGRLIVRNNFTDAFWGCENFPHCRHTENIEEMDLIS